MELTALHGAQSSSGRFPTHRPSLPMGWVPCLLLPSSVRMRLTEKSVGGNTTHSLIVVLGEHRPRKYFDKRQPTVGWWHTASTAAANLLFDGANGSIIAWASNKLPTEPHLLLGACDGLMQGFIHSRKVAPPSRRAHLPLSALHLPCLTTSYPLFSIPGTWSLCPIAMATSLTPGTPALRCSQALADTQADAEQLGKISFFSESCSKAVPWDPLGCWLSVSKLSIWRPATTEQGWFISLLHELPGTSNPNLKELKKAVPRAQDPDWLLNPENFTGCHQFSKPLRGW